MMMAAQHVPRTAVITSYTFSLYMLAELSTMSVSSTPGNSESLIKERVTRRQLAKVGSTSTGMGQKWSPEVSAPVSPQTMRLLLLSVSAGCLLLP